MGYSLKNTLLTGFLRLYFELHESVSQKGFPYRKLKEFSNLIFVKRFLKTNSRSNLLIRKIKYVMWITFVKMIKQSIIYTPFKIQNNF